MVCPSVRGDNSRALASGLSFAQAGKPWYNYIVLQIMLLIDINKYVSEEYNRTHQSFRHTLKLQKTGTPNCPKLELVYVAVMNPKETKNMTGNGDLEFCTLSLHL